jgi:AcrR family transcriptional regulator
MNTISAKDRILETASELFFNQGYNLTGINQIIEESKIAKGSLYYNFKSKTDVLLSYLQMSDEILFKEFENELKKHNKTKDKIIALTDLRFKLLKKGKYKGCRFVRIVSEISKEEESVILPVVRNFKEKFHNLIYQLTLGLNKESELDSKVLADTIYLLMEGASAQASVFKDDTAFIKTRKIIIDML